MPMPPPRNPLMRDRYSRPHGLRFGFTGTRAYDPRNAYHRAAMRALIPTGTTLDGSNFFVGCAVGGDEAAATLAWEHGLWVHGIYPAHGAWDRDISSTIGPHLRSAEMLDYGTPIDRDQYLVDRIDWLYALPLHAEDDLRSKRSGTWATVRMARRAGKIDEASIIVLDEWLARVRQEYVGGTP